jgi:ribosomal protein S27E
MRRDFNPNSADEDFFGNNATFRCNNCRRIYIVSGLHKNGRPCPFCGKTVAHVKGSRNEDGSAWIESAPPAQKPR